MLQSDMYLHNAYYINHMQEFNLLDIVRYRSVFEIDIHIDVYKSSYMHTSICSICLLEAFFFQIRIITIQVV